jgi:hypothetical protein
MGETWLLSIVPSVTQVVTISYIFKFDLQGKCFTLELHEEIVISFSWKNIYRRWLIIMESFKYFTAKIILITVHAGECFNNEGLLSRYSILN